MATNQHGAKVGDVLVASWGYDQTNIDFFAVIAVTKTGVRLLERGSVAASDDGPQVSVTPGAIRTHQETREWVELDDGTHRCEVTGTEECESFFRRTREAWDGDGYAVRWRDHTHARLWDGNLETQTGLGWVH